MEEPREAHLERIERDEGWYDIVFTDGHARAQFGPFRYKHEAADYMLWLRDAYARLDVLEGRSWSQYVNVTEAEREELARLNRRDRSKPDLADLMREAED